MKSIRREWALITAYILFMVFLLSQHAFILGVAASPEKMKQVHGFTTLGNVLGALLLPLILPFDYLREGPKKRLFRQPKKRIPFAIRLVLVGAFFIPNIVIRLLGQRAWLDNSFNSAFMAVTNGIIVTLMTGSIFSNNGKYRVLWPALAISISNCVFYYVSGPGRELLPFLFGFAGLSMTGAGVLILVYLAALKPDGAEDESAAKVEEYPTNGIGVRPTGRIEWLFPALATLVIFWTNTFTNQLFLPSLGKYFLPGFNISSLTIIFAMPVLGILASLWWRRFLSIFIHVFFFLFLLSSSLLFFNHSQLLFLILHALNLNIVRVMTLVYPFVIVDMCCDKEGKQRSTGGYWAWLAAGLIQIIHINALVPTGLFRPLSLADGYAVILLTVAAFVFYLLSRKILPLNPKDNPQNKTQAITPIAATQNIGDILREHNLSGREMAVALLMVQEGLSNEEIGERLFISKNTIKFHVYNIYQKFSVKKRAAFLAKVLTDR